MLNWIKLEPGCKMPEIDEFVLWRTQDGNYFVREIDKDDWDWWNHGETDWGTAITHWARIPDPEEQISQNDLWEEIDQEYSSYSPYETLKSLKSKYIISRK